MTMTEEVSNEIRKDMESIAASVAGYYASLLGNGLKEGQALELTKAFQEIWLIKIFTPKTQ